MVDNIILDGEHSGSASKKSYRIAVVGDKESVIGFKAVGFSVFIAADSLAAEETIRSLDNKPTGEEYAVIFLVENYAKNMRHVLEKYASRPIPAIISIPGKNGSDGFGMAQIKKAVERAVGADILFKE